MVMTAGINKSKFPMNKNVNNIDSIHRKLHAKNHQC